MNRGEGALPATMCLGCGMVLATITEHCVHVSRCPEPKVRPWVCPGCLADNWRRPTCRSCDRPAPPGVRAECRTPLAAHERHTPAVQRRCRHRLCYSDSGHWDGCLFPGDTRGGEAGTA